MNVPGNIVLDPEPGIWLRRTLPGGREISVIPLTFNRARVCIGLSSDPTGNLDGW